MHFGKFIGGIIIFLVPVFYVFAQQEQAGITHCLDPATRAVSLSDANINGTIFIDSSDHIRGIRRDIPTTYVIANSDHYKSFGNKGSFSPDGKWFVYPTGTSERANWQDRHYHATRLNFIDTRTGLLVFYIPIDTYLFFVSGSYPLRPEYATTNWLSSTHYMLDESTVINVETQSLENFIDLIPPEELAGGIISPDLERMIINKRIIDIASGETLFETENIVRWLKDGTGYYVLSSDLTTISVYNDDGRLRFSVGDFNTFTTVSSTGRWLAWGEYSGDYPDGTYNFFIMNTEGKQVTELCTEVRDIVFSPDDTQAVILTNEINQSRMWLLNLENWKATPVDIYLSMANRFVGWYAD